MSKEKLRILIVEDNEDDLALLLRELNKGKYEIYFEHVEDSEGFHSTIKKKWDIIISDYSLPNFNGFEALKICNDFGIDTPFIIVSGTIGEDIAVEMMKNGAKDYIMKKSLKRLLPVVEREIQDAKIRRERKQAEQEITMLAYAMKSINECVSVTDIDDNIIFINQAFLRIYGYTENEIIGKNISIFGSDKNPKEIHREIHSLAKKGVWQGELINKKKDGTEFPIYLSSTYILNNEGKPIAYIGVANDITNRKQAEESLKESEEHYRTLLNAIPDLMFRLDEKGKFVDYHAEDLSILFTPPEKFLGKYYYDILPPDVANKLKMIIESSKKTGETGKFEYNASINDNEIRFYESRVTCFGNESVAIVRDITEQKNAEKALIESENKYRSIFENVQDIFYQTDSNGIITEISPSVQKYAGYKREELIGKPADVFYQDQKEREIFLNEMQKNGKVTDYELKLLTQDGIIRYSSVSAHLRFDANNNPVGLEGSLRDISERKIIEKALIESEERYRKIYEESPFGIALVNSDFQFIKTNPEFCKMMGYTEKELISKTFKDITHPEHIHEDIENINRLIKGEISVYNTEKRYLRKDKKISWGEINVSVVLDSEKRFLYLLAIIEDITQRKIAEQAVKESEEHFKQIVRNAEAAYFRINADGFYEEINQSWLRIHKYSSADEVIGKHFVITQVDQDMEKAKEIVAGLMKGKPIETGEFSRLCKDGTIGYHTFSINPVFKKGEITGIEGFLIDITHQKKALEELNASQERYRILIETMNEGVILVDNNDVIQFVNKNCREIYGYKPEELIGKIGYKTLVAEEDRHIILEKNTSRLNSIADSYEIRGLKKSGEIIWLRINGAPVKDKDGKVMGSVGIMVDITERKKIEETLKESEERYRILIETMNDGIMQVDNNDVIQFVNNSMCEILGYTYHELIGKFGIEMLIFEEDREFVREKNRLRTEGVSDVYEVRAVKKSGEIMWLTISGTPVADKSGNVIGSVGFVNDITERKRAEEEVLKISQAIKQSPVAVVITDVKGDIEYVNPKFVEVTGYYPEEAIGRNPRILKSGEKSLEQYKELWNTISSGKDWTGEFHNKRKNGELYWENASISPVKNSEGKITHFLAVKEDVTEKKLKEIELIKAKEKAEESERLKSSFLANMSHELRTPMVGILGFAELLKDMAENRELKDFAGNILKSGKRLLETLNLILDLSRIEAGKLDMKKSEVDIVQLTNEVYLNYIAEAAKKNLKILFKSSEEQIISKVDERMLWESINNLINNAVKYTKKGQVSIEVTAINKKAIIRVSDTGLGIPKESLDIIFEEFRQVSEGYSRGFEGTGLGLTITKRFIEKSGGNITVESELGVGSIFTIEIPLLESHKFITSENEIEEEEKPVLENKDVCILCVDDDSFTREYLEHILKDIYKLTFAENGIVAIEIAKSQRFDLILMDINLGKGMDGIEATRKIHKLPHCEKVPVIAMTAFAMKGDKEEFLNFGLTDYISKPFKSIELIKLVNSTINK